tara:strand:- start:7199 stop:7474 length:276 start_codon:yes stop_codon:yes gene_type:complete
MEYQEKVVEDILFELIVLATEVPVKDYEISIIQIGVLSEFDNSTLNHFILAGVELMETRNYQAFSKLYADFLVAAEKEDLAIAINDKANTL